MTTNKKNLQSSGLLGSRLLLVSAYLSGRYINFLITQLFWLFFQSNKAVVIMKNLLKKSIIGLSVVAFGLTLVFTQSAFKTKKLDVVYQYTNPSHDPADIKNILNWEVVDSQTPSCGEEGSVVCQYTFPGDMEEFQEFLEDPGTTASQINLNATATKE